MKAEADRDAVAAGRSPDVAGNELELQRGAAAKTEGEDRNDGGENRHHNGDGTTSPRKSPHFPALWRFEQGQRALGREIIVLEVRGLDFETAFATFVEQRSDALIVGAFSFFLNPPGNRDKILELAARHKITAMYPNRQYAVHGGLMSYDSDFAAVVRQLGSHYVGQILKGAKAGDLPVMQPTKFELVINLKTAKALGLNVPDRLLALADEVIE